MLSVGWQKGSKPSDSQTHLTREATIFLNEGYCLRKMKRLRLILLLIPLIGGLNPLVNLSQGHLYAQSEGLSSTVKETLKNDEILGDFSIVPLVVNGVVTLYGAVDTQEQLSRVTEIVLGIAGVKSAVNKVVALDNAKEESAKEDDSREDPPMDPSQVDGNDDVEESSEIVYSSPDIPNNVPEFHIAKPGESLQDISDKYGVDPQTIRRLNGMGAAQQPAAFQKILMGGSGEFDEAQNTVSNTDGESSSETVVLEVLGSNEGEAPKNDSSESFEEEENPRPISSEQSESSSEAETRTKPSKAEQEAMRPKPQLIEAETVIRNGWVFHRVARNENDAQIADYYNVSLAELRQKNGLRPGAPLRRGSLIRVKKSNE